jgi:hypothetical protein
VSLSIHFFIHSLEYVCCLVSLSLWLSFSHHHHHQKQQQQQQHLLGFCYTERWREPMLVRTAMSIYIDIQSHPFFLFLFFATIRNEMYMCI